MHNACTMQEYNFATKMTESAMLAYKTMHAYNLGLGPAPFLVGYLSQIRLSCLFLQDWNQCASNSEKSKLANQRNPCFLYHILWSPVSLSDILRDLLWQDDSALWFVLRLWKHFPSWSQSFDNCAGPAALDCLRRRRWQESGNRSCGSTRQHCQCKAAYVLFRGEALGLQVGSQPCCGDGCRHDHRSWGWYFLRGGLHTASEEGGPGSSACCLGAPWQAMLGKTYVSDLEKALETPINQYSMLPRGVQGRGISSPRPVGGSRTPRRRSAHLWEASQLLQCAGAAR